MNHADLDYEIGNRGGNRFSLRVRLFSRFESFFCQNRIPNQIEFMSMGTIQE